MSPRISWYAPTCKKQPNSKLLHFEYVPIALMNCVGLQNGAPQNGLFRAGMQFLPKSVAFRLK